MRVTGLYYPFTKESLRLPFLAWEWLHVQIGNEYGEVHDFRRFALPQIETILSVHSGLIVHQQKGRRGQKSGLIISNLSTPSVAPKVDRQVEAPAKRKRSEAPLAGIEGGRYLNRETLEKFKKKYPGINPYVCEADFHEWLKDKPAAIQPTDYNLAFLYFAKRWIRGKF
jgi:hypothetical protein